MLTLQDVLRWLQKLGVWPADMLPTDDAATLGLTDDDLDRQKAEERQQRAERERQRRTVNIDDKPFDLNDGFASLRAALDDALDRTPEFLTTPRKFTGLQEIDSRPGRGARTSGGGFGGGRSTSELSSLQKLGGGFRRRVVRVSVAGAALRRRLHSGVLGFEVPRAGLSRHR
ncbi:hypothetical protein [Phytohabitans suffuscus]|uniref:Uncharacterized protein n=1 Tax=Phytohabitans suffuscus TaxID=624315 RepID=A0A6F8YIY8_9ACTN|nr:hypothetical protein [Phytohabitans suffuscus]BCB86095.1 hypothetical protein Psuf_034080 [Phytohabitans suffuscus]